MREITIGKPQPGKKYLVNRVSDIMLIKHPVKEMVSDLYVEANKVVGNPHYIWLDLTCFDFIKNKLPEKQNV